MGAAACIGENNGSMELHQLRYFIAVARAKSFTRAATDEGLAQPTLSHQIQKLETELGVPLLERLGRSVRLTHFGEDFLPRAQQILRGVEEAQLSLASLEQGVRGKLSIGVIPTIMPWFLAPRIAGFLARFPEVEVRLVEDVTARLVEGLQAGELDVAVASPPIANADVVCSELFREQILLAVARNHRLADAETVDLSEIRSERLLLLKEGHCFREQALATCTRARAQFESTFESDQFSSLFPLVASGFGVSLIPEMAAPFAIDCRLISTGKSGHRRVGYLRNRRCFYSNQTKAFTEWLREQAKTMGKADPQSRLYVPTPAGCISAPSVIPRRA
jgi:LysR family hydrogen peroxide-inducible transcriptional activator